MARFCQNCGAALRQSARFCPGCGAPIPMGEPVPAAVPENPDTAGGSGNIRLCPDGKYRWVYEFSMLKNPTILLTIWKILAICCLIPALIVILSDLKWEGAGALLSGAKVYGFALLVITAVSLLAYFILAAIYGGKYIVLFEMDNEGITHIQQPRQFKKAQGLAWLTMLAGAVGNNLAATGLGISVATKNAVSSSFPYVKSVQGFPRRNTIKLHEVFAHNQVYVEKEDYDFVWHYIISRCEKAKIR